MREGPVGAQGTVSALGLRLPLLRGREHSPWPSGSKARLPLLSQLRLLPMTPGGPGSFSSSRNPGARFPDSQGRGLQSGRDPISGVCRGPTGWV